MMISTFTFFEHYIIHDFETDLEEIEVDQIIIKLPQYEVYSLLQLKLSNLQGPIFQITGPTQLY